MKWNPNDENDKRVVEHTDWLNIKDYRSFQDRAGVYIFADEEKDVKYIGTAGAGRIVDEISDAISRGKDSGATKVKVLYTNSSNDAASLESDLIDKYRPPNNKT